MPLENEKQSFEGENEFDYIAEVEKIGCVLLFFLPSPPGKKRSSCAPRCARNGQVRSCDFEEKLIKLGNKI